MNSLSKRYRKRLFLHKRNAVLNATTLQESAHFLFKTSSNNSQTDDIGEHYLILHVFLSSVSIFLRQITLSIRKTKPHNPPMDFFSQRIEFGDLMPICYRFLMKVLESIAFEQIDEAFHIQGA